MARILRKHVICPKCGWSFDLFAPLEKKILLALENRSLKFSDLKKETKASNPSVAHTLKVLLAMELVERTENKQYTLKPNVNLATLTDFHE